MKKVKSRMMGKSICDEYAIIRILALQQCSYRISKLSPLTITES